MNKINRIKKVICASGISGWQANLQTNYESFEEFENYSNTYGIHSRIGYATLKDAWDANPLVQGSVNPSDFRKVVSKFKFTLSHACSKYGAQMGRRVSIPDDAKTQKVKMHMLKLRFVGGDYDQGGAYWGFMPGQALYQACGETETEQVEVFTRAKNRKQAKDKVKTLVPLATFFR
jgi:hypothetical protein